jgi:hypothetical protein
MQRERAFAIVGSMVATTGTSQKTWAFDAAITLRSPLHRSRCHLCYRRPTVNTVAEVPNRSATEKYATHHTRRFLVETAAGSHVLRIGCNDAPRPLRRQWPLPVKVDVASTSAARVSPSPVVPSSPAAASRSDWQTGEMLRDRRAPVGWDGQGPKARRYPVHQCIPLRSGRRAPSCRSTWKTGFRSRT